MGDPKSSEDIAREAARAAKLMLYGRGVLDDLTGADEDALIDCFEKAISSAVEARDKEIEHLKEQRRAVCAENEEAWNAVEARDKEWVEMLGCYAVAGPIANTPEFMKREMEATDYRNERELERLEARAEFYAKQVSEQVAIRSEAVEAARAEERDALVRIVYRYAALSCASDIVREIRARGKEKA